MNAIIITIGDEILVGQTIDSNSAHIAKKLNELGIQIKEIISIADEANHITRTVDRVINDCEILILTGGLGPTNDDITKKVLTNYFNDELIIYPKTLARIQDFFNRFNKPFLEVNRLQAMLPKSATIIENDLGTASGMWFKKDKCNILSLPGVPYEMKGLLTKFLAAIKEIYPIGNFYHRTLQISGIGESYLAELIKDWEAKNLALGISVSYLPSIGSLKLRLTGKLDQKTIIDQHLEELHTNYSKYIVGEEGETLEIIVGRLLVDKSMTLGTVESCTGGSIAKKVVSMPGSSAFYLGSIISYTNDLKAKLVGVKQSTLDANGAVSKQVVEEMAQQGKVKLDVDYCISVSGIAGPTGGSEEKPVGTVWVGIAGPQGTVSKQFNFGLTRNKNIQSSVMASLNFLRLILTNQFEKEA